MTDRGQSYGTLAAAARTELFAAPDRNLTAMFIDQAAGALRTSVASLNKDVTTTFSISGLSGTT